MRDERSQTEVGGRRIGWRSVGEGDPLLLVNGYAATAADWDPTFLAGLAASHRIICPDNRGMGESELGGPGELTVEAMAEDLEAVLDALEVESAPVVGWSMGGYAVQALAARASERVSAMALLSTDPGGSAAVRADPEVWSRLTDHSGTPREQASRLIALLFPADVAAEIDRQFGGVVAEARAALDPEALSAQEAVMDAWHAEDQPEPGADLSAVLIAHGTEDVVIPPANADALAAHWWDSNAERFEGGGHGFMAQEPERLANLIGSFLE